MEVRHLTGSDVRRQPWKNGRGSTEELAVWPEGSSFDRGDFDWRISKASVDRPGPFSSFPGFDRLLVVTEGEVLLLAHGGAAGRARLRRFEPHRFSGDWTTTAELPAGEIADFGVLFRRGSVDADVHVLDLGRRSAREALPAGHAFAHVLSGRALARVTGEEEPLALRPLDSVWIRGASAGVELELAGRADPCVVVLVTLRDV